ncbi:cell division protein ZipA C-terminal FtsZ-binding domain-containing protein [Legionella dresdenensis]|uniref:Cell division protein ZipA n=1 Tax=Legionella dresdenensis TaxID=450200 RepID=A0ABV8CFV9_9GAMM
MQANWSLILNVLLLIGVIAAIGRLMKARRQSLNLPVTAQPSLGADKQFDDIIAVRKISQDDTLDNDDDFPVIETAAEKRPRVFIDEEKEEASTSRQEAKTEGGKSIMIFLLAKENRQLAGYELLQTVLAAGLRFGEGNLFHRHQHANGQGPVVCSLAAATASGVFDLQNIGAFSVRGLCLFMQSSGNPVIDAERFSIMLETARHLSDGLDAQLLDDRQRPLTNSALKNYYRILNIQEETGAEEILA